jgi:glycosyltransferase involved in cell wall biosynthesis
MQPSIKISYAICTHNETHSLKKLIDLLKSNIDENDEIVIVDDMSTNPETIKQLKRINCVIHKKLGNDFASQKNLFFQICKGDYIFNIDSDELPSIDLIKDIKKICNDGYDLIYIPRRNYVDELSKDQIVKWGFRVGTDGRVNYPDYQGRVYKNKKELRWKSCVHEHIVNFKKSKRLPQKTSYYIDHIKSNEAQTKSNSLYSKISRDKSDFDSEFVILNCYFNPCDYKSKFINFQKTIKYFDQFEFPSLTIESFKDNSKYRIYTNTKNVISVKSESTFWQKENLLNIGIEFLKKFDCKYILVLDGDIKFSSDNWIREIKQASRVNDITHIFKKTNRIDSYNKKIRKLNTILHRINENQSNEQKLNLLLERDGEPGYGYCFKKDVFANVNLYDKCIMGSGDFFNLISNYRCKGFSKKIKNDRFFRKATTEFVSDYLDYVNKFFSPDVKVGYANCELDTFYHGEIVNREYVNRESILSKFKFDPTTDIKKNQIGVYEVTNKILEKRIYKYFQNRDEDANHTSLSYGLVTNILKPKERVISCFKFKSSDNLVIATTYNSKKVSINRIECLNTIFIDSSSTPSILSYTSGFDKVPSNFYNFFCFIYTFYHALPDCCYFVSPNALRYNYVSDINRDIKSNNEMSSNLTFLHGSKCKIKTKYTDYIRNEVKFSSWLKYIGAREYKINKTYIQGPTFKVTRNGIHTRPKEFYVELCDLLKKYPTTYNFLIERTLEDIFQ